MGALSRRAFRLAFIPVVQFIRDFQIDKKPSRCADALSLVYALGLELTDPGFDFVRHVTWQSIADAIGT